MNNRDERTVYLNTAEAPAWIREWIAKGWQVFNAPRPLPGVASELWEFLHGTFYTAIDPALPEAARVLQDVSDLDGWPVVLLTNEDIKAKVLAHIEGEDVDLDDLLDTWGGWPGLARAARWPWSDR